MTKCMHPFALIAYNQKGEATHCTHCGKPLTRYAEEDNREERWGS